MRLARILICRALSSPLTYSTRQRWLRLPATCNSSVLLPMPGSPPSRMALPVTRPPPNTRSSSSLPVEERGSCRSSTSLRATISLLRVVWYLAAFSAVLLGAGAGVLRRSSKVFHSPQSGQQPSQRAAS